MRALAVGVHVLDVLVRPVEEIPEGQGGALVEQIRLTAAGSAGGTALVLARLGAQVRSAGAIGTDAASDMLLWLLEREGIDTALLARREDVQTSASVLPIRPRSTSRSSTQPAAATPSPPATCGLSLGLAPPDAARPGCAAAAQVAGGLGTDAGAYDLETIRALFA